MVDDWRTGPLKSEKPDSELKYWKTTYRVQFAILLMASAFLSERFLFPPLLKVSWQGTTIEEMSFVFILWFISSLIIGSIMIATTLFLVFKFFKTTDEDGKLDRSGIIGQLYAGSAMRWLMSLSPCIGPPFSLAIISQFYRTQLFFPDTATLTQACVLLALVSFLLCLPLTLNAQRTLKARVEEKFPGVVLEDESEPDEKN